MKNYTNGNDHREKYPVYNTRVDACTEVVRVVRSFVRQRGEKCTYQRNALAKSRENWGAGSVNKDVRREAGADVLLGP